MLPLCFAEVDEICGSWLISDTGGMCSLQWSPTCLVADVTRWDTGYVLQERKKRTYFVLLPTFITVFSLTEQVFMIMFFGGY